MRRKPTTIHLARGTDRVGFFLCGRSAWEHREDRVTVFSRNVTCPDCRAADREALPSTPPTPERKP